jgi:GNAT superfamily N-acetyltransferase
MDDPRFTTGPLRNKNVEALKQCFEGALRGAPVSHWLTQLHERGVPAGPINNVAQILADPQIKVRNMVVTAQDPVAGTLHMAGNPIKLSAFHDPSTRGAPPELDGDRVEIIRELNESQLHLARTKADDAASIRDYMDKRSGTVRLPGPRGLRDISALNGFVARNSMGLAGLASFELDVDTAHLIWLDSAHPGRGCGGALLQAVIDLARSEGCRKLCTLVGNNNLTAAGFLQKRGFSISGVRAGALAEYRAENPDFIAPGDTAIPARDFLELELSL